MAPDNTAVDPPGLVRFPNSGQLAPGASVQLVAIGNAATAGKFEAGTLGVVGTGHVTADGVYVESNPAADSGLITFGWIGYRPAP